MEWVSNPELTLKDAQNGFDANECHGRGRDTAAARGYNVERLAAAVFDSDGFFHTYRDKPWFDTSEWGNDSQKICIESKSCVHRYPSGGYGQFRIWALHHDIFTHPPEPLSHGRQIYFFLVYTIDEHGDAEEVGKLAVEAIIIDDIITDWRWTDHTTMGSVKKRDISWHLLLSRLGVSVKRFRADDIVVVTDPTDE
ncbi:hypothetical protein [Haloplanus salinarum]